mmetsp:Transcript_472/g.1478  ORF Transcript_472/g.1478 Transcript_472/m.1478 type:complete len:91 (+) Transcript_472:302-574(+)
MRIVEDCMVVVWVNQHKRATGKVKPQPTVAKLPAHTLELVVLQKHLPEELTLSTSISEDVKNRRGCMRNLWHTQTPLDDLGEGLILLCSN